MASATTGLTGSRHTQTLWSLTSSWQLQSTGAWPGEFGGMLVGSTAAGSAAGSSVVLGFKPAAALMMRGMCAWKPLLVVQCPFGLQTIFVASFHRIMFLCV